MTQRTHRLFSRSIIAASLMAALPALASTSGIVISQIYGGNGNTYNADYVELFNAGNAAVTMANWSIQYASSTGTGNFSGNGITTINATLQPGRYYLVKLPTTSTGSGAALSADLSGSTATNLSATKGKVVLLNTNAGLGCNGGSNACNATQLAQIVDLVGYGDANFSEGSPVTGLSNVKALLRAGDGCTDTNNNAADFTAGTPNPRNSGSPVKSCSGGGIVLSCPAGSLVQGSAGSVILSGTDTDSRVNAASLAAGTPAGFSLGTLNAAGADGATATVDLLADASLAAGSYAVTVNFANDDAQTASCTVNFIVTGNTPIYGIQGSGATSPLAGQSVTTHGVVTKVNNNGFFMQDETGDGDDATSDGIFVYTSSAPAVAVGDRVRVAATVAEYAVGTGAGAVANPLTELTAPTVTVLGSDFSIVPTVIPFPEAAEGDLERHEGMLVTLEGPLTVSQNYFQGRYGQVTLGAGGRLEKPTNRHPAGSPEALALADENARRRILLDDGSSVQNPNPLPYVGADNTLRAGDVVQGVTGVIDYGLATNYTDGISDFKIHPTVAPVIVRANARPATPPAVGGNVKVAAFNVLNYFTTIDQSGAACYPGGTRSDCRGADSAVEFSRQKAKIVAALQALNADAVGLMEIENNGNVAVNDLVAGLNAVMGAGTYVSVAIPAGAGTGTDAIRVAMIYKPARLTPVGSAVSDADPIHNRPPLAQTFAAANGEKFTVVVNHFKSKGSCPSAAADANADQGDGQGCWNARRVEQAQALRTFLQNLQAATGDADVLVTGDINAYGKEDPVLDFTAGGYVDQIARFGDFGYSYVFDGEGGYLDHALATPGLSAQIAGAAHWRINADEPSVIDYNTEYKNTPDCATSTCSSPDYYAATAYRSSDHDPVLVGLHLVKTIAGTAGRDALAGTAGDDVLTGGIGADTLTGGAGSDTFVYNSLRDATDTITDFQPGSDKLALRTLLQSLGIASAAPLAEGYVVCRGQGADAMIAVDPDAGGTAAARNLVLLKGLGCASFGPDDIRF